MIKIRLKRLGSKRKPFYRVVVASSRVQRDGKYIELVGTFNPKLGGLKINKDIAMKWLKLGAKPTPTVKKMLSHEGIMTEFANFKTNSKLKVESKSGTPFGSEVDPKVNYTQPGTKPKVAESKEQAKAAKEVTIEEANNEPEINEKEPVANKESKLNKESDLNKETDKEQKSTQENSTQENSTQETTEKLTK